MRNEHLDNFRPIFIRGYSFSAVLQQIKEIILPYREPSKPAFE